VVEVLAVEADDERRHEQQRRDHRQPLHHLVLIDGDLALEVVADAREGVARRLEGFARAHELVVGVAEGDLDVARKELPLVELDPVVDDLVHGVAGRREGAADPAHVLAQLAQAQPHLRRRLDGDQIFQLVDLIVERVDQIEVALGDLVDQVVDEHADVVVNAACVLRRRRVERLLARRRLRDRHQPRFGRDEVDLLVKEPVLARHLDRDEENAEDIVTVGLDARTRLVVVDVRREQRPERRGADARRQLLAQRILRRVDQVDPLRALGRHPRQTRWSRPPRLRGAARSSPSPDGLRARPGTAPRREPTGSPSRRR
jgi:hypothetical protein